MFLPKKMKPQKSETPAAAAVSPEQQKQAMRRQVKPATAPAPTRPAAQVQPQQAVDTQQKSLMSKMKNRMPRKGGTV